MTLSAADLVQEHIKLDDFCKAETKKFTAHLEPHKKRMEEIQNLLLNLLNEQKSKSMATDHGTAYISTIMTPKIMDRDEYIHFIWDHYGAWADLLQIREPQKEALRDYMEQENEPPPGVEVSYFNRLNIRRS